MNNYLYLTIGLMLTLLFIGQAYESRSIDQRIVLLGNNTYQITNSTGTFIVNGTLSTLEYSGGNIIFGISLAEGILASSVAIVALGTAIGVKFVDSGLSDQAQKVIFNFAIYGGIWGIFSILSFGLILGMPLGGLQWFLFFIFSFIHLLGILQEIK